jgi:hypothetical protein
MGGNDTAIIEDPLGISVSGGEGDDTLTSTSVGNILSGDNGNDILFGIDANDLYGGAGDDEITFDSDVDLNDRTALVDGGPGDDIINIFADAGIENPDRGGAVVSGGEGSDTFNVTLDLLDMPFEPFGDDGVLETDIVRLSDFNPAEDTITIEIARTDEIDEREISQIDFNQTQTGSEFRTELSLYFEATNAALEAATHFTIISNAPFTQSDITFVNV